MADLKPSKLLGKARSAARDATSNTYGVGTFNIDRFRAQLFTGVSHTNHFRVLFAAPRIFQIASGLDQLAKKIKVPSIDVADLFGAPLTFMCYGASIPGKQVSHVEYRDSGPVRKIPNGYSVEDLTLSFYTRVSMPERYLFETWIDIMTGNFVSAEGPPQNRYSMKFYDDIHTSIIVEKWSPDGNPEYAYKFSEAYPVALQEIPLSWEMNNEMVKFNVTFAYRDWSGVPIPIDLAANSAEALLNKIHL